MAIVRFLAVAALALLVEAPAFGQANDSVERSIALFREAGKVLQHPRCLNCHPPGDSPTQTDAMRPHIPKVVRGVDGHGVPGLPCSACHHDANDQAARVPGHAGWQLAPQSMSWAGRSLGEICALIKDPALNGGRDLPALLRHVSEPSLVSWAWSPGGGRTPAPGTQAEFGALMQAWVASGAHCPAN
jgi:hypothetical protein